MSSKRANKILGLVVASISVVALILVLVVKEPTPQLETNSPQRTVQQYLQSVTDRDFDTAVTYLVSDSKCTVEDFDRAYIQESLRIDLAEVTATDTTALIKFSIHTSSDDPFSGSYTDTQSLRLTKSEADWKITGIPWPTYECGGVYR